MCRKENRADARPGNLYFADDGRCYGHCSCGWVGQRGKKGPDPVSWPNVLGVHTGERCYMLPSVKEEHQKRGSRTSIQHKFWYTVKAQYMVII